ncbi:MAG TPA: hypothetical protein VLG37_03890 [Candidatus Saccharimonadales bacterium]|nr:hypothetical protein [Candidatus Saccharimonadales bacterium]
MRKKSENNLVPTGLIEDYSEVGVEKLIKETQQFVPALDKLSAEIPYVKTVVAAIKFPRTLSDFLLGKKMSAFLYSSGIDEKKLAKFKKKFSRTKQERLWERLIFSINTHDDKIKSEIVGKLFAALIDDTISEDEFFDMVHATNSLNLNTLEKLKQLYMLAFSETLPASLYYSFATLGLIGIDNSGIGTLNGGGPSYPLNQLGWKYAGIVYDYPESSIGGVKIGIDPLVSELDKDSKMTNHAYPLRVIKQKGSSYKEVDLFVLNEKAEVLCDSKTLLPKCMGSAVILAGENGETTVKQVALGLGISNPPYGIHLRNLEDEHVQKWAFMVKSQESTKITVFRTLASAKEQIQILVDKNDYSRYLMAVADEMDRPVNKLKL